MSRGVQRLQLGEQRRHELVLRAQLVHLLRARRLRLTPPRLHHWTTSSVTFASSIAIAHCNSTSSDSRESVAASRRATPGRTAASVVSFANYG